MNITRKIYFIAICTMLPTSLLKGVFVFYITQKLNLKSSQANMLFATYSMIGYLLPIIGGYISSRYISPRNGWMLGALLSSIGILLLSISQYWALKVGLATFAMSTALYIPNNYTIFDEQLCKKSSQERSKGFVCLYFFMNLGAFLGYSFGGIVGSWIGYHEVFLIGGLVNLGSFAIICTIKDNNPKYIYKLTNNLISLAYIIIMFALSYLVIDYYGISDILALIFSVIGIGIVCFSDRKEINISIYFIFGLLTALFWMLFNLVPTSVNELMNNSIKESIHGFILSSTMLLGLGPLILMACYPIYNGSLKLVTSTNAVNIAKNKFLISMILIAISFLVLGFGIETGTDLFLLTLFMLFVLRGFAEIINVPTGYEIVCRISSNENKKPYLLGAWRLFGAVGIILSGFLANFLDVSGHRSRHGVQLNGSGYEFVYLGSISLLIVCVFYYFTSLTEKHFKSITPVIEANKK